MSHILTTSDGSPTIYNSIVGECYHSSRGAIEEALHVYVTPCFKLHAGDPINVLEVGFGTGLNALLCMRQALQHSRVVHYQTIEAYPVAKNLWQQLPYADLLACSQHDYSQLHELAWEQVHQLNPYFTFSKREVLLQHYAPNTYFDVVFFDAFSPESQPEMWSEASFHTIYSCMNPGGCLLTYCSKGVVKRTLRQLGFEVKRLPGAGGKRHMICAVKPAIDGSTNNLQ